MDDPTPPTKRHLESAGRDSPVALPGPQPDADAEVRAAGAALSRSALPHGCRLALGDERAAVPREAPRDPDREARQGSVRTLRVGRGWHQDPLPRGRGDD